MAALRRDDGTEPTIIRDATEELDAAMAKPRLWGGRARARGGRCEGSGPRVAVRTLDPPDLVPLTRRIRALLCARHRTPLEDALMPADYGTETASYMSAPVSDENAPLIPSSTRQSLPVRAPN